MSGEIAPALEAIRRCIQLREAANVEAVLRSELQSALRVIFPSKEDQKWINHYVEGAEARTKIGKTGGGEASRFIDNLVGSTTIEYEADLRNLMKRQVGLGQVKEQMAGLIRSGVPMEQVRGILSDTVEWHTYDAKLAPEVAPSACQPDHITLVPIENLSLVADEDSAKRLILFIRKHLAREKSRTLNSTFLALDLGLASSTHARNVDVLRKLVADGRSQDVSLRLATDLWSQFIDYLEGEAGGFRADPYVDEIYVAILARILSANILAGVALLSEDSELEGILTGDYFRAKFSIENMVEKDYFGWIVKPAYLGKVLTIAREIQLDLYAYDFSRWDHDDLFGQLMADFARRSQRKLLGQEWTPEWLARQLAERCLALVPNNEAPRIIDMCCGSGTMLAAILQATKARFGYTAIAQLQQVATGIDIDPLSVILSKTTWITTLASEIKAAAAPITIPIYHADSLFTVTPVSRALPLIDETSPIEIKLEGTSVSIPNFLIRPEFVRLFDRIVDWAYDEAIDAQRSGALSVTVDHVRQFLSTTFTALGISIPKEFDESLTSGVFALLKRMAELAIENRNGIWAFILRNTYRPSLLSGQFNGLVSNPPWLAMSALADNPYRAELTNRSKLYGIRPVAQSFLHLELGTMHLLHAVDRYLKAGAAIACVVPGTIFNGNHHEPFRQREYLKSRRSVPFDVAEVWQVERGTFKYPGAALLGRKAASVREIAGHEIVGAIARASGIEQAEFSVRVVGGSRSAWTLEKGGDPIGANPNAMIPLQGADLMPRTAVCVEVVDGAGAEVRVDTPQKDWRWGFTIKAAKELKVSRFPGHVAPQFIHAMAQSENLLQFSLGAHRAPVALPAIRDANGRWIIYDDADIRRMGFTQTARRFQTINAALESVGKGKTLQERIDERNKLTKQVFDSADHLVISGAGGKHIAAAYVSGEEGQELVFDQTVYWQVFKSEEEAWYNVGVLNSPALTAAISPFNPQGDFGERHIHTLPYRLLPAYDPHNSDHARIAQLAKDLALIVSERIAGDSYLNNPAKALPARRRRLREFLFADPVFCELEELCAPALATTAFGEDSE